MPANAQNKIKPQLKTFDMTMVVAGLVIGMGIFPKLFLMFHRASRTLNKTPFYEQPSF
jgi:hypothetical protein